MVSREEYSCDFLCGIIHPEGGAEVLATYEDDFYAGIPCVTCNTFGKGKAYYIGTQPEQKFLEELMEKTILAMRSCEASVQQEME